MFWLAIGIIVYEFVGLFGVGLVAVCGFGLRG